jgi:hypothetical protein
MQSKAFSLKVTGFYDAVWQIGFLMRKVDKK